MTRKLSGSRHSGADLRFTLPVLVLLALPGLALLAVPGCGGRESGDASLNANQPREGGASAPDAEEQPQLSEDQLDRKLDAIERDIDPAAP